MWIFYRNFILLIIGIRNSSLTIKSILGKIRAIYSGFGAELKPDDNKNRGRCDYTLYYPVWPRSEFSYYEPWLKEFLNKEKALTLSLINHGGEDIELHADKNDRMGYSLFFDPVKALLKFYNWSVNKWFSQYAEPYSMFTQLRFVRVVK